jgi:hypothetical protein
LPVIMRAPFCYALLLLLSVVLSTMQLGCTQSEPPSMVLLNDSALPCWFDICPAITDKTGAMSSLARIPFVDASTIVAKSENTPGSYIHWRFKPEVMDFGRIYYHDDQVSYISIYPRLEDHLTVHDVVAKYGTPEFVWAYSDWADARWLYLALVYRDKGLYVVSFDSDWQSAEVAKISSETPVTEVIFFDPTSFEDLMTEFEGTNWRGAGYSFADIMLRLQPWQGYGEINVVNRHP